VGGGAALISGGRPRSKLVKGMFFCCEDCIFSFLCDEKRVTSHFVSFVVTKQKPITSN
jgi:hypothetical protein